MEKLGVREDEDLKKEAQQDCDNPKCPTCGQEVERHGYVFKCPTCGTEPFEKTE